MIFFTGPKIPKPVQKKSVFYNTMKKQTQKNPDIFYPDYTILMQASYLINILNTLLPIVATGAFANFSGLDFSKMIARKAKWINKNRKNLNNAIRAS